VTSKGRNIDRALHVALSEKRGHATIQDLMLELKEIEYTVSYIRCCTDHGWSSDAKL